MDEAYCCIELAKVRALGSLDNILNLTREADSAEGYAGIVAVLKPLFDEACKEAADAASLMHFCEACAANT